MHLADRTAREAEQDRGDVLRLQLERAEPVREARDAVDVADEPARVVELVDRIEHDAAAGCAAHGIAVAVVLAGPPVGEPRAELEPRRDDATDCACAGELAQPAQAGVEAKVARDERSRSVPVGGLDQLVDAVEGGGKRFLDEEVGARLDGLACDVDVERGGCGDEHDGCAGGKRGGDVGRGLRADGGGRSLAPGRIRIDGDQVRAAERSEVAEMAGTDRAAADDGEAPVHRETSARSAATTKAASSAPSWGKSGSERMRSYADSATGQSPGPVPKRSR